MIELDNTMLLFIGSETIVVGKSLGPHGLYEFESRSRHNLKSKGVGSIPTASRL